MQLEKSAYHALLRVSAVVMCCVLVFQSGLVSDITQDLANNTQAYLASTIGVKASVTPNELNKYTAQITAREVELDEREAMIEAREVEVGIGSGGFPAPTTELTTFLLSIILFILTVLIVLNYVLDYLHRNPLPRQRSTNDNTAPEQQF